MSNTVRLAAATSALLVAGAVLSCTAVQATPDAPPPPAASSSYPAATPPAEQLYKVDSVYDGDTLRVFTPDGNSVPVRVLGIDAPEMRTAPAPEDLGRTDAPPPGPECGAVEARDAARAVLQGKSVRLTEDLEQPGQDRYSRLLRYVYVDGEDLADVLLNAGLVRVYEQYPVRHTPRYLEEQARARTGGAGSWAVCGWEN